MGRTAEMILGILGGIFGIIAGVLVVLIGGFGASEIIGLGFAAIILGIIGIIGGAIANRNIKWARNLMLFSGVVGFIAISLFWIISGMLLIAGGLLAFRKNRKAEEPIEGREEKVSTIEKLGKMGIPGFRSGKKWKMAIAILGYFLLFLILLALIFPSPTPREPTRAIFTPTPTSSPIPSPIDPKILSSSEYISDSGYYTVVGEVQNNLQSNVNYVKIIATFYDAQNTVIGTDSTYTDIETLKPGQKSPFEISSYPEKISPSRYKLSLDYSPASNEPFSGLEVLSQSSKIDDLGYHQIVGEVKNNGDRKASFVKVVVTYYDSAGKAMGKSYSYTNPQDITNGDTAPFEISSYSRKISPARYEIQVEGK